MRISVYHCLVCLGLTFLINNGVISQRSSCSENVEYENPTYVLTTNNWLNNSRFYPDFGNGFIGSQLFADSVFATGLYNGAKGESHRARIQQMLPYTIKPLQNDSDSLELLEISLDMGHGRVKLGSSSSSLKVEQFFYAHRSHSNLLVTEIHVNSSEKCQEIQLHDFSGLPSADLNLTQTPLNFSNYQTNKACRCGQECFPNVRATLFKGRTITPETATSKTLPIFIISSTWPSKLSLSAGVSKFVFIQSIGFTLKQTIKKFRAGLGDALLLHRHSCEWEHMWNSSSIETSDLNMSQHIISNFYYLLSSLPSSRAVNRFDFFGMSPGGISHGGKNSEYLGHVFWDQDFWMLPPLLPFFPEFAKLVIEYRIRNLQQAVQKATKMGGYGAAYPWETGRTGAEVCPGWPYIYYELHVTGDIIHLLEKYVMATGDYKIFTRGICDGGRRQMKTKDLSCRCAPPLHTGPCLTAWDLLRETACFWTSKATWNASSERYDINRVMGPDEYHYPVNNSVYTNAVVIKNLVFAINVATRLDICSWMVTWWKSFASRIQFGYDPVRDFHPQFDGFDASNTSAIKQADAVMLSFPINVAMAPQTRTNDLLIYSNLTSASGPAMTWSMFAINWLGVDNMEKADRSYLRQLANVQPPFNMWTEQSDGTGSVNFLTGIGGHLQSVVYGYFGMRILPDRMIIDPVLIPMDESRVNGMRMKGVKYRKVKFSLHVNATHSTFVMMRWRRRRRHDSEDRRRDRCMTIFSINHKLKSSLCHPNEAATFLLDRYDLVVV